MRLPEGGDRRRYAGAALVATVLVAVAIAMVAGRLVRLVIPGVGGSVANVVVGAVVGWLVGSWGGRHLVAIRRVDRAPKGPEGNE